MSLVLEWRLGDELTGQPVVSKKLQHRRVFRPAAQKCLVLASDSISVWLINASRPKISVGAVLAE